MTCRFCHLPPNGYDSNILTLAFNMEPCCNQCRLRCCRLRLRLPCWETSWAAQMTHRCLECVYARNTVPSAGVKQQQQARAFNTLTNCLVERSDWSSSVQIQHNNKDQLQGNLTTVVLPILLDIYDIKIYFVRVSEGRFRSQPVGWAWEPDYQHWLTLPILRWSLFLASSWKRSHSFSIFESGKETP